MLSETLVRILFASLFYPAIIIGFYYRIKSQNKIDRLDHLKNEGAIIFYVLRILGLSVWLICLWYPIFPKYFRVFNFITNPLYQYIGLVMSAASIPLLYWVFKSIGKNITDTVTVRESHQLVTKGIYKFVQHPLYAIGLVYIIGLGLLSNNLLLIIIMTIVFLVLKIRLTKEEKYLEQRFGNEYVRYKKRTGRFIPKLDFFQGNE